MKESEPSAKYAERASQLDLHMLIYRVPDHVRRVLVVVRLLSWAKNRDAAPIQEIQLMAQAMHMDKGDCSRAIEEAKKMKVLRVERLAGSWWLELLPDTAVWIDRSATKVKGKRNGRKKSKCAPNSEEVAQAMAAWSVLVSEGDPAQAALPMEVKPTHPPLGDGGLGDALAETSRENADYQSKLGNSQLEKPTTTPWTAQLENSQLEAQKTNSGQLGNSQFTHAGARARKHEHEHGTPSVPQSMVPCDHGQSIADGDCFAGMDVEDLEPLLDQESRHWYGQLEEIFGDDDAEAFRLTWLKRLCDQWRNCAWRAIGAVKRMKLQGERFSKGPGQCANFYFNKYRYAAFVASKEKGK